MCEEVEESDHDRIRELHDVAFDLQTASTTEDVCRRTVEAAERVLSFDNCIVALEEGGELSVKAQSSALPSDGVAPAMSVTEGLAGLTYRTGESYLLDDVSSFEAANPQGPYESALSVPIGDAGIFQAASEELDAFRNRDLEVAELLVSHTRNALDRIEHEQDLQRFTSIISHDLRNPLNIAQGRVELAREECESEHLDAVVQAHERMNTLIEDLLTVARGGEAVSEFDSVRLDRAIERCWRSVRTADATLDLETDRVIRADPSGLRQLLENLLHNAVEHGGESVTISIGHLDDDSGFYLEDDGPGIPEAERGAVFDPGYTTTSEGTGFGLVVVERIAAAHGWTVRATDGADGGARFEILGVEFESR